MAKCIMIQGTMSNAGKSLLVAALLRILKQDGYKVAPFKSQNMALNSYVTKEGLEMGRAQVMQAEAAKITPSVCMNPILLKPCSEMGSQVIVNGEVISNMHAKDYFAYKKQLLPEVKKAYEKLEEEYDIIVIEGAGSPAEINLTKDDIVNMGMARLVNAPVLLVGDIDRGGVFAQLFGTVMLLEEEDRLRIKGTIINKFRGDYEILSPGISMITEKINIPCVGVVPFMDVDIEDEDSLSERFDTKVEKGMIDIVVIRLPRISNFTDFYALEHREDVTLRYVSRVSELKSPDLIIIPGTKSTMEDLLWLRENGLEAVIKKQAVQGTLIFGICGGYQMLGNQIKDEYGIEGMGELRGMELLPMNTSFAKEKVRTQVKGIVHGIHGPYERLTGAELMGYEIHMGVSTVLNNNSEVETFSQLVEDGKSKEDGLVKGNVLGTYVHGIFDTTSMQDALFQILYEKKGLAPTLIATKSYEAYKQEQFDRLADGVRKSIDMNMIYDILGLERDKKVEKVK